MSDHVPGELPNELTRVDADNLGGAVVQAWQRLWSEMPRRESVLVLLAHSALETGRWKSCHCWNLGNVKSRVGDGRDWTHYRCNEVEHGRVVWYDPPHPQTRFRAFRSLEEGTVDHLAFLRGNRRYAQAWPYVLAGEPRAFVRELKKAGYFTATLEPYENSVASIFYEYSNLLTFPLRPLNTGPRDDVALTDEERARVMNLVALSLRDLSAELDEQHTRKTDPDSIA